jgi:hypothetical protein
VPTHPRQTIREYLVGLLAGAGTIAGSSVFDTRVYARTEAPAIFVSALEDQAQSYVSLATRAVDRQARITIQCLVADSTDPEDSLDTLCREVELAIEGDFLLGTGGSQLLLLNQYEGTVIELPEQDGAKSTLTATITYLATYRDEFA